MTAPAGTNLTSGTSVVTTGPYTTASITVHNGELVLVTFLSRGTTPRNLSSVTGLGLTWSSPHNNAGASSRILGYAWAYNNSGSDQTGTLSIATSGASSIGVDWSVDKFTGARASGPINVVDNNGTNSPGTATEAAYASPDSTAVLVCAQASNATASMSGATFYGAGTAGVRINASNDHWIAGIEGGTPTTSLSMTIGSGVWATIGLEIPAKAVSLPVALTLTGTVAKLKALAKTIAYANGGVYDIEPRPGHGTKVINHFQNLNISLQSLGGTAIARSVLKAVSRTITGTLGNVQQKVAGILAALTPTMSFGITRAVAKPVAYALTATVAKVKAIAREIDYAWTFKVTGVIDNRDIIIRRLVAKTVAYANSGVYDIEPRPGHGNKVINKAYELNGNPSAATNVGLFHFVWTTGPNTTAGVSTINRAVGKLIEAPLNGMLATPFVSRITAKFAKILPLSASTGAPNEGVAVWTVAVLGVRIKAVLVALSPTLTTAVAVRRAFVRLVALTMPPGGTSGTTDAAPMTSRLGRIRLGRSRLGGATGAVVSSGASGSIIDGVSRRTGKSVSRTVTLTALIGRGYRLGVALAITGTAAVARAVSHRVSRTFTAAPAVARTVGKAVSRTITLTAAAAHGLAKTVALAITASPLVSRSSRLLVAATFTATPIITTVKSLFRAVTLAFTATPNVARSTGKAIAAGVTLIPSAARSVGKAVQAAFTGQPSVSRAIVQRALTLPMNLLPEVVTSHIFARVVALAASFAVTVNRRIPQAARATVTMAVSKSKRVGKAIRRTLTLKPVTVRRKVAIVYRLIVAGFPFLRVKMSEPEAHIGASDASVSTDTWKVGPPTR